MPGRLVKAAVILLPIIGILLAASSALAAGVGVTPGKMEFRVPPGVIDKKTLYVINPSDEESKFLVYVEGEHKEWFKIMPSEFTLGPEETRSVEVAVAPPFTAFIASGHHDFSICVVSLPPGYNLNVGAGARIAAHVQILGLPYLLSWVSSLMAIQWWIVTALLIIALIIGIIVGRRWRVRRG